MLQSMGLQRIGDDSVTELNLQKKVHYKHRRNNTEYLQPQLRMTKIMGGRLLRGWMFTQLQCLIPRISYHFQKGPRSWAHLVVISAK